MSRVAGIDPGLSGAVALLDDEGMKPLQVWDMPTVKIMRNSKMKRELNLAELAEIIWQLGEGTPVFVERVGAMPGQGVTSMFSFGKSYGAVLGILAAYHHPVFHVAPQTWKKAVGVRDGGKGASRLRASELFPSAAGQWSRVKDDGRAEAALIAYYGKYHAIPASAIPQKG